jgi:hypothetical protein
VILPCPPCPDCGARVRVDYDTTLRSNGRCVETLLEACEHERKRRGVCRYCWRAVGGKVGQSVSCNDHRAHHKRVRDRQRARSFYAANREKQRQKRRARYHADRETARAAEKQRYWSDPEKQRARKRRAA